jgi:hypothetical protein
MIFILITNLIQGWEKGFMTPINYHHIEGCVECGIEFYHDAINIEDPIDLLYHYEERQADLLIHSRVHPPGALLTIFILLKLLGHPALMSIMIAVISIFLSMLFLNKILLYEFESDHSTYMTYLFVMMPSIQIYYLATIDALIASLLLGAMYYFLHHRPAISFIIPLFLLFLASFMTFLFVFILPVMAGFDLLRRRNVWRSGSIIIGLGLIYLVIYEAIDFNYINSFRIAAAIDNPDGFRLFSDPISYFFTRLEGIFEIALFFGPFLTVVMIRGIRLERKNHCDLQLLTLLALATIFIMFITGCYQTGETARVCLFMYPYLLFPISLYLQNFDFCSREKRILLLLVFAQTIFMQMFGHYLW